MKIEEILKDQAKRFSRAIKENYKGLAVSIGALIGEYGIDIGPTHGAYGGILGPVGHVLMGPVFMKAGDAVHSYVGKGNKRFYELAIIGIGNVGFQVGKAMYIFDFAGVGHDFEPDKILLGVVGGLVAMAYDHFTNREVLACD